VKKALWFGFGVAALLAAAPELAAALKLKFWEGVRSELNALPIKKRCVVAWRIIRGQL